jgi:hypothetical protein
MQLTAGSGLAAKRGREEVTADVAKVQKVAAGSNPGILIF